MSKSIYIHEEVIHNTKAPKEVLPIFFDIYRPDSILDVGCGLGTWLSVAKDLGVHEIKGIDGDYVDKSKLTILESDFIPLDLTKKFDINKKFDLAISLEVAEHLPEESAEGFIESITKHAEVVLFSAALPGQGGQNHINEQSLTYWKNIFLRFDYVLYDIVRPKIWNNTNVEVWYKQNTVVFCKKGNPAAQKFSEYNTNTLDIIHPELFAYYHMHAGRADLIEQGKAGMKTALSIFINSLKQKFS